MSRISRGRIELVRAQVDVGEILRQLVHDAQPLFTANALEVSLSLPARPIEVDADPMRLAQGVNNLLQNACKFTGEGDRIHLSLTREGEDALVRVTDTGVGLSPEQLDRVFDLFAQVDSPLSRKGGGLGLGLALARSLVELSGGSIEAHSPEPGQGSEFRVRLRALPDPTEPSETDHAATRDRPSPERERHPEPSPEPSPEPRPESVRRILAADDNADGLAALVMLLQMKGHQVETAPDGLQALEKARQLRPEVVLLDIGMPGLDGYEVARRIRREAWGRDMLLVAMTGWGQERDKTQAREAGFDTHMTKPIDSALLDQILAMPANDGSHKN